MSLLSVPARVYNSERSCVILSPALRFMGLVDPNLVAETEKYVQRIIPDSMKVGDLLKADLRWQEHRRCCLVLLSAFVTTITNVKRGDEKAAHVFDPFAKDSMCHVSACYAAEWLRDAPPTQVRELSNTDQQPWNFSTVKEARMSLVHFFQSLDSMAQYANDCDRVMFLYFLLTYVRPAFHTSVPSGTVEAVTHMFKNKYVSHAVHRICQRHSSECLRLMRDTYHHIPDLSGTHMYFQTFVLCSAYLNRTNTPWHLVVKRHCQHHNDVTHRLMWAPQCGWMDDVSEMELDSQSAFASLGSSSFGHDMHGCSCDAFREELCKHRLDDIVCSYAYFHQDDDANANTNNIPENLEFTLVQGTSREDNSLVTFAHMCCVSDVYTRKNIDWRRDQV